VAEGLVDLPRYKLESILDVYSLKNDLRAHGAADDVEGTFRFIRKAIEIYERVEA
jgi:hypothetical protein